MPTAIRVWILPFSILFGAFLLIFSGSFMLDYWLYVDPKDGSPLDVLFHMDSTSEESISPIPEVVAGVLGIAITVGAIIVELAANRYTSRVVDLFVTDRTNLYVMGLFVVSCVFTVWVMKSNSDLLTPKTGILISLVMMSFSVLLLVPYFNYIFEFLDPKNIINKIRVQISGAIEGEIDTKSEDPVLLASVKSDIARAAEQITDIALNSIHQQDRTLAMDCVVTLKQVLIDYLDHKHELPDAWFAVARRDLTDRADPDYVSLSDVGLMEIESSRTWVEHKIFKQLHLIYGTSLNNLRDVSNLIGMSIRDIAVKAIEKEDRRVRWLAVKFFNTLLRTSISQRDVRTTYNLFSQYRLLAEHLLETKQLFIAEQIFSYFKYYGQLADAMGVSFLLETVAYDLYRLCRVADDHDARNFNELLEIFLQVDRPADMLEKEDHLLGVRKAQVMLGSYFQARDQVDLADRILEDVHTEPLRRLYSIRDAIQKAERNFWEITDRGTNFDYLEPEYRAGFHTFFARLEEKAKERTQRKPGTPAPASKAGDSGPSAEATAESPPPGKKRPKSAAEIMAEVAKLREKMDAEKAAKASKTDAPSKS